jgi:hypothetical protein
MLLRFVAGSSLAIAFAYLSRRSLEEKFLRMGFASKAVNAPTEPVRSDVTSGYGDR